MTPARVPMSVPLLVEHVHGIHAPCHTRQSCRIIDDQVFGHGCAPHGRVRGPCGGRRRDRPGGDATAVHGGHARGEERPERAMSQFACPVHRGARESAVPSARGVERTPPAARASLAAGTACRKPWSERCCRGPGRRAGCRGRRPAVRRRGRPEQGRAPRGDRGALPSPSSSGGLSRERSRAGPSASAGAADGSVPPGSAPTHPADALTAADRPIYRFRSAEAAVHDETLWQMVRAGREPSSGRGRSGPGPRRPHGRPAAARESGRNPLVAAA